MLLGTYVHPALCLVTSVPRQKVMTTYHLSVYHAISVHTYQHNLLQLYSLTLAFISVLFGALPVGAGWYPWYEGWIVMATLVIIIFVLFSSDTDNVNSVPLMKKL